MSVSTNSDSILSRWILTFFPSSPNVSLIYKHTPPFKLDLFPRDMNAITFSTRSGYAKPQTKTLCHLFLLSPVSHQRSLHGPLQSPVLSFPRVYIFPSPASLAFVTTQKVGPALRGKESLFKKKNCNLVKISKPKCVKLFIIRSTQCLLITLFSIEKGLSISLNFHSSEPSLM